jgi:hypothetical protein
MSWICLEKRKWGIKQYNHRRGWILEGDRSSKPNVQVHTEGHLQHHQGWLVSQCIPRLSKEKVSFLVVGKAKQSQRFKNIKSLSRTWHHDRAAWMMWMNFFLWVSCLPWQEGTPLHYSVPCIPKGYRKPKKCASGIFSLKIQPQCCSL